MKKNNRSGFTLVEIMIVVALLSLISVIGLTAIKNGYASAKAGLKETNIASVESAKEQWALLKNKPAGTAVSWSDIEDYIGYGITSQDDLDIDGASITLNAIGTTASYPCDE